MGEEGVGGEFGELGGPDVGGENFFEGNPTGVYLDECLDGGLAFGCFSSADEDAIGVEEVFDCGSFGQKFRIRKNLESYIGGAIVKNGADRFGGANREGGFFDDDLI